MNAYEELQEAARSTVTWMVTDTPEGREKAAQSLLTLILRVVGRIGHNVGVDGEADMNERSEDELLYAAHFALFLTGNRIDDAAYEMRRQLHLEV